MNTNFQTIHQMGTAINEFVKQATGRDNVQNIDIDHVTVAQNHYYEDVDVSGTIASFMASAVVPLTSCIVQIEPIQSGSGDPAPDNVRPITGWTGAKVQRTGKNLFNGVYTHYGITSQQNIFSISESDSRIAIIPCKPSTTYTARKLTYSNRFIICSSDVYPNPGTQLTNYYNSSVEGMETKSFTVDANAKYIVIGVTTSSAKEEPQMQVEFGSTATSYEPYQGQTYSISWQTEAGTVYGGTLDVTTGTLVVDRAMVTFDGTQAVGFAEGTSTNRIAWNAYVTEGAIGTAFISNLLKLSEPASSIKSDPWLIYNGNGVPRMFMTVPKNIASIEDFNAYAKQNNINVVYYLAEPQTYQLTPVEITTLLGQNNIWADTGDIEVKFTDIKELY